jgi:SAM-dependent methyltransferase
MFRSKIPGNLEAEVRRIVESMLPLTATQQQPNINQLWMHLRDFDVLRLNTKNFGYTMARQLQPALAAIDTKGQPQRYDVVSKPTTQEDVESPWFVHWCQQLKAAPIYHRKLWEFAFLLQALFDQKKLNAGHKGLGFGCGQEPIASYLASIGIETLVTDLDPAEVTDPGWAQTGQHTTAKEMAFFPELVSRSDFDAYVSHRYINMNRIPNIDAVYDFCWSICAMEHLGSIDAGLRFVKKSLDCLRPGGVAIHTTEFNYRSNEDTVDNWPTVLFRRRDFETLINELRAEGHVVLGPDFDVGDKVLDQFIDIPPYSFKDGWLAMDKLGKEDQSAHLKLSVDGFPCTCFGLIIIKSH